MMLFIISYISSLVTLLAIDACWLIVMARFFYQQHIGHLMSAAPALIPAVLFYLLYALGLVMFVVAPAVEIDEPLVKTFLYGALLGLVAYGTYDLTNQATLSGWPAIVTVVDLIWGSLLTGTVAVVASTVTRYFVR